MKKTLFLIFVIISLILSSGADTAKAETVRGGLELRAEEHKDVLEAYDAQQSSDYKYTVKFIYPCYDVDFDLTKIYHDKGSLTSGISGDYSFVPVTENGTFSVMYKRDNVWTLGVTAVNAPTDPRAATSVVDADIVKKRMNEAGADDCTAKCIGLSKASPALGYFLTIVVFEKDGIEYAVPFSVRPDFTGLENGKLYTSGELVSIFEESYLKDYRQNKEAAIETGEALYGSAGENSPYPANHTAENAGDKNSPGNGKILIFISAVIASAAVLAAAAIFIVIKKRSASKKA